MSCRSAKYLEKDQALVVNNEIKGIPGDLKEEAQNYISNEVRPNSRMNLFIYNLFNTKRGKYKTEKIRNVGEPPNIVDTSLVELSGQHIEGFLVNKGFFDAKVLPDIKVRKKKATIHYNVQSGPSYNLGEIQHTIKDSALEKIYTREVIPESKLESGNRYDMSDFIWQRELAYEKFKNHGYYDYVRQYMQVEVDTLGHSGQADIEIEVDTPETGEPHQIYHLRDIYISVHHAEQNTDYTKGKLDTNFNIIFSDQTGKFKLKPLSRYVFLNKGDTYSLEAENLSYDRLYEMNGFRSVKIEYEKVDSTKLDVYYDLVPRQVMGNQIEGEYTFSSGMSGFNIGNTFSHRNVFGGAEQLDIKLRYGVLFDPRLSGGLSQKVFNNDVQLGINLTIPRIWVPFYTRSVGRFGLAKTTLSSNFQLFNQLKTYYNRYFINTLNYSWYESIYKQHSLSPIVLEYRKGRLNKDFENQLTEDGYLLYVRSNNREYFGLGAQYSFTLNAPKLLRKETFSFFRGSLETSGNLLSILGNSFSFKRNELGERMLFEVPYLQYAKAEVDFRRYLHFSGQRQLVLRANAGVALPYGNNSSLLIFEKSFYGGGINGMRAWQARTLGPGNYNREGVPEYLRLNLRNLDQLGELKLEANAEYRFRLLNNFFGAKLNGATFLDMGNIWRLQENELNPKGEFLARDFWKQIAIGTGLGLRFDMDYFIVRLDMGLKVKDPQFEGNKQWVIQDLFRAKEFKRAYFQTHSPDRYNFIQYNLGVGLPF